jgi:hypothetical protein
MRRAATSLALKKLNVGSLNDLSTLEGISMGMGMGNGIVAAIGFAAFMACAGPLDDLKQNLSQGMSGAIGNAASSALGARGQSSNDATNPQGQSSNAAASTGMGSAGSVLCITQENRGTRGIFVRNTCADPVIAIISLPSNTCTTPGLKPGGGAVYAAGKVIASCRKAGRIAPHDCQCPSGTEITSTSDTAPMAAPAKVPAAFTTNANGCPARDDDPRYRDMPKGSRCTR